MIVLVTGGRDFNDFRFVSDVLDAYHSKGEIVLLLQGGAEGADSHAAHWAKQRQIPWLTLPAKWGKLGKAAGPIRNQQMLGFLGLRPDYVLAFEGGRGTADMIARAKAEGIPVYKPTP